MNSNEIREQQRQTWNKFSSGWRKWDNHVLSWLRPVGDELIKSVSLKENYNVLDAATGTGEPGLTAALLVPKGKVVGQDLAEDMIQLAKENARIRGIKNYETVSCDVSKMPFPDNHFDALMARFGFMFFPDMQKAANEMARIVKPGAKISTSVWGMPEKNAWATVILGTINQMMQIPPLPDGAPGLFRCAKPGMMKDIFEKAGLKNVSEKEVSGTNSFDSAEHYWEFMNDIAAPVVSALSKADEEMKTKIRSAALEKAQKFSSNGKISLPWCAVVIAGEK